MIKVHTWECVRWKSLLGHFTWLCFQAPGLIYPCILRLFLRGNLDLRIDVFNFFIQQMNGKKWAYSTRQKEETIQSNQQAPHRALLFVAAAAVQDDCAQKLQQRCNKGNLAKPKYGTIFLWLEVVQTATRKGADGYRHRCLDKRAILQVNKNPRQQGFSYNFMDFPSLSAFVIARVQKTYFGLNDAWVQLLPMTV